MSVDAAEWHRRPGRVCEWLLVCGDLHDDVATARRQLAGWEALGITDIVDLREEWSDEGLVAEVCPEIAYHHLGTQDLGHGQPDDWWATGAGIAARRQPVDRLLVHCHMGVNRGPSMAFRMLLADGWGVTAALDAIRAARPIAAVLYADSALEHHVAASGCSRVDARSVFDELEEWQRRNPIDVHGVVSRIRRAG